MIVDGMNVIGSRGDGWWLHRDEAVRGFTRELSERAGPSGEEWVVVFDGRLPPGLVEGRHDGVRVLSAGRSGRNAADDRIVELVEADPRPWSLTVVTSDRRLRDRVRRRGARVVGARALLDELEGRAGS